jgi:hypothetical protein
MTENEDNIAGHRADGTQGYEKKDVNPAWIITITLIAIGLLTVIGVALNEFFLISREDQVYEATLKPGSAALRELRAHEEEVLNSYRIIDSSKNQYQIPIDRAMELMADEAFQARQNRAKEKSGT